MPGVSGRMGLAVAEQVLQAKDLILAVATVRESNPMAGNKLANSDLDIATGLRNSNFDVLIDFTLPAGVMKHLQHCLQQKSAMVIGTTGFTPEQTEQLQQAATQIPILMAANMSIGVNIFYKLLTTAANMLDSTWHRSVHEVHHIHKKDAPSGTAKQIARIIATSDIQSERRGEVIGEHTVTFATGSEKIELAHISMDRNIYAIGAVTAARWLYGKKPGMYSMQDVITSV